jgi:hypothetical protein
MVKDKLFGMDCVPLREIRAGVQSRTKTGIAKKSNFFYEIWQPCPEAVMEDEVRSLPSLPRNGRCFRLKMAARVK